MLKALFSKYEGMYLVYLPHQVRLKTVIQIWYWTGTPGKRSYWWNPDLSSCLGRQWDMAQIVIEMECALSYRIFQTKSLVNSCLSSLLRYPKYLPFRILTPCCERWNSQSTTGRNRAEVIPSWEAVGLSIISLLMTFKCHSLKLLSRLDSFKLSLGMS